MSRIEFTPKFAFFLFFALAINAAYFWLAINPVDVSVSLDESGAIETVQLVYLASGAALFLAAAAMLSKADRMLCIGVSVLGLVFFLRELEIDKTGPISTYLQSKSFRAHEALVVAAVAVVYLIFRWRLVSDVVRYVFSKTAWPFYIAGVLLLAGALFDMLHGSVSNLIKEEIFECSSYLSLVLVAGMVCYQQPGAILRSRSADFLMVVVTVCLFAGACWLTELVNR